MGKLSYLKTQQNDNIYVTVLTLKPYLFFSVTEFEHVGLATSNNSLLSAMERPFNVFAISTVAALAFAILASSSIRF